MIPAAKHGSGGAETCKQGRFAARLSRALLRGQAHSGRDSGIEHAPCFPPPSSGCELHELSAREDWKQVYAGFGDWG